MAIEAITTESYREARLDLIVAQELHSDIEFATWLWDRAGGVSGQPTAVEVELNVAETGPEVPPNAHGETDVRAILSLADGRSSVLLIENKVWATFQPRQAERYRLRADAIGGRALLIAPSSRQLSREHNDAFDGYVTIEELADWFASQRDQRGPWLSRVLTGLVRRRETPDPHQPTVDFTEYCVNWFNSRSTSAVPRVNSLRTTGQGWLEFETPATLTYKVTGLVSLDHAMVDLYVEHLGLDADAARRILESRPCAVERVDGTEGRFEVAEDTKRNTLLRYPVPKLNPASGVPTDPADCATLEEALRACAAAVAWSDATMSA